MIEEVKYKKCSFLFQWLIFFLPLHFKHYIWEVWGEKGVAAEIIVSKKNWEKKQRLFVQMSLALFPLQGLLFI